MELLLFSSIAGPFLGDTILDTGKSADARFDTPAIPVSSLSSADLIYALLIFSFNFCQTKKSPRNENVFLYFWNSVNSSWEVQGLMYREVAVINVSCSLSQVSALFGAVYLWGRSSFKSGLQKYNMATNAILAIHKRKSSVEAQLTKPISGLTSRWSLSYRSFKCS